MDSVDSYASTFLALAYRAYMTGNAGLQALVAGNITTLEAIAALLVNPVPNGVRVNSGPVAGLTEPLPGYNAVFTMDNVETWAGLNDLAALEDALGRQSQQSYYQGYANATVDALETELWNPATGTWDQSATETGGQWSVTTSDVATWYPDAVIQLWPIAWQLVTSASTYAQDSWTAFVSAWPNWDANRTGGTVPYASMARAGQAMGDTAGASTLLSTFESQGPLWPWPWSADQAGWVLRTAAH